MDVLLAYPNHSKPFDIKTNASDYQLSAIIKQDNCPVAYYARKLNSAQKKYTTIKKELLSIVETLKEFRSMLLGAPITIYTDHKNFTHKLSSFSTQCILRWCLLLEEFVATTSTRKAPKTLSPTCSAASRCLAW
jgi:RNase H-like domain found in reverse transcriptase